MSDRKGRYSGLDTRKIQVNVPRSSSLCANNIQAVDIYGTEMYKGLGEEASFPLFKAKILKFN